MLGPGSTNLAIKQALGLNGTLLGCDVLMPTDGPQKMPRRATLELRAEFSTVISFTRHQGFLLGRGNQQLSPESCKALTGSRMSRCCRGAATRWHSVPCW